MCIPLSFNLFKLLSSNIISTCFPNDPLISTYLGNKKQSHSSKNGMKFDDVEEYYRARHEIFFVLYSFTAIDSNRIAPFPKIVRTEKNLGSSRLLNLQIFSKHSNILFLESYHIQYIFSPAKSNLRILHHLDKV